MVSYPPKCAEEVKGYVHDFVDSQIIPAINGGVVKSDSCVDVSLRDELQEAASALRKEIEGLKGSFRSVKDIVDPSLFPFVFEKTKVLRYGPTALSDCIRKCGEGEAVKLPPENDSRELDPIKYPNEVAWSRHFQWLPFDIRLENRGDGASRYVSTHLLEILQPWLRFRPSGL